MNSMGLEEAGANPSCQRDMRDFCQRWGVAHLRFLGLKYLQLQQGKELDILCLVSYLVTEMYMKMKRTELGASVLMISGFTSGSNFWKHYVPLRGRETSQLWLYLDKFLIEDATIERHCLKHLNLDLYFLLDHGLHTGGCGGIFQPWQVCAFSVCS